MHRNLQQKKQIVFCFGLILISQLPTLAAPRTWDGQKVKQEQKKTLELVKDYNVMKDPIEFPDLPMFNGHTKFITGYLRPNQNGVTTCEMQFVAQEEPQNVVGFYKDALAANQWKILFANSRTISAQHGKGHMCNINVSGSKMPKTKSKFTVDYRHLERQ